MGLYVRLGIQLSLSSGEIQLHLEAKQVLNGSPTTSQDFFCECIRFTGYLLLISAVRHDAKHNGWAHHRLLIRPSLAFGRRLCLSYIVSALDILLRDQYSWQISFPYTIAFQMRPFYRQEDQPGLLSMDTESSICVQGY